MRSTATLNHVSCVSSGLLRRRSLLTLGTALVIALAPGCVTAPPPVPTPDPAPPVAPPAIVTPVSQSAAPPELPPIIIHHADLHGKLESRQGSTITIRALLMMTKTKPEVGNRGVLFYSPTGAQGAEEWVALGDVEVQKQLDGEGRIQIKITGDDKKFMIPGGKRPTPLAKNTRVRLNWEW